MLGNTLNTHNMHVHHCYNPTSDISSSNISSSRMTVDNPRDSSDDLHYRSESFRMLHDGLETSNVAKEKCAWLQSQLIGHGLEFDTPFGRRILTYADHTASGRCLHYIENFIIRNVLPFYGNTHTSDSQVGSITTKMVHEAVAYVKSCMGGRPDDVLLFCGSGTTAAIKRLQEIMGIAVPSTMRERVIRTLKSEERWVVFVGPYEHHSNLLSWRQSLAEVVEISCDSEGLVDVEALKHELESSKYSNRPMLGSFSACSNVTGIHTDTRALAYLLHQHGAFACFDFAASGPYVKIDMRSGDIEGYDAVFLSPHKFVGGPGSPGILLMSKALYQLGSLPPSTCGGGTVSYVNGLNEKDTLYYDNIEEREDAGTPPIVQKIRAAMAFWVKEYMGRSLINSLDHGRVELALKSLLPNPNIYVLGNTHVSRLPIISFLVLSTRNSPNDMKNEYIDGGIHLWGEGGNNVDKPLHGRFVAKLLNDLFGIQARGGCACAGPYGHHLLNVDARLSLAIRLAIQKGYEGIKPGWTRISLSYYMSNKEVEFILSAVEFIAVYGQCFLPLYHLNWKTGNWSLRKSIYSSTNGSSREQAWLHITTSEIEIQEENDGSDVNKNKLADLMNNDKKVAEVINKYALYLQMAKYIVDSLPKFPSQRNIPKDIDQNLILFRI